MIISAAKEMTKTEMFLGKLIFDIVSSERDVSLLTCLNYSLIGLKKNKRLANASPLFIISFSEKFFVRFFSIFGNGDLVQIKSRIKSAEVTL